MVDLAKRPFDVIIFQHQTHAGREGTIFVVRGHTEVDEHKFLVSDG